MSNIQEFDYSVDLLRAILWQDNNAVEMQSILTQKQAWYDANQTQFWDDWYTNIFDIRTANEFGLSVWAVILGIPTSLIETPVLKPNFGFGSFNTNFNHATFGTLGATSVGLTLEEKRILLRLRYFKLVSNCTIPATNDFLQKLFADFGSVYILDNGNMAITYVFTYQPGVAFLSLVQSLDVLPRMAGVKIRFILTPRPVFGFGAYNQNFNNGNFRT